MKKTFVLLVVSLLALACVRVEQGPETAVEAEKPKDGAFIHISKGAKEPHAVLMALMLADKFSTSNDVLVFFDQQGIDMVVKGAPNLEMEPFDGSDKIIERLLERNVEILACPACLKAAGYEEGDLREGVKIAVKERFFDFTKGRILTLDY